jgi:hypothetical protein
MHMKWRLYPTQSGRPRNSGGRGGDAGGRSGAGGSGGSGGGGESGKRASGWKTASNTWEKNAWVVGAELKACEPDHAMGARADACRRRRCSLGPSNPTDSKLWRPTDAGLTNRQGRSDLTFIDQHTTQAVCCARVSRRSSGRRGGGGAPPYIGGKVAKS